MILMICIINLLYYVCSYSPTCYSVSDAEYVCDNCEVGYNGTHCQQYVLCY